ncbi:c-type cytochrome biogenesis protein CcmI [Alteromonas gilva]|uniref:C-type cytochrome biogenesis protein CcmI n=1 Tax=Alteromonas gilva TaxID=2987522 RepID=A0ABT5L6I8_9ALTE|nr:c-type cytochrome biogenesis protein CcmI [Alteromonas gilva]MDC8832669.1 c-type cytochrome biogenesis protein CcmI [Alteromonas gilva]
MTWMFFATVFVLVVLLFLAVVLPWLRARGPQENLTQANIAVVKQRLTELQREVEEGILSEQDMRQASDEIKISLVEEQYAQVDQQSPATLALCIGAALALAVGGWAYYQASNLTRLSDAQAALNALPQLSAKLAEGAGENFTSEDFQQLTLAIRKRLQNDPDDGQGWMYLGRVWMALGQTQEAYSALEKALHYAPDDADVRMTYARALMGSDDKEQLQNAQRLLSRLVTEQPDNNNLTLMLAVVAGRLGDQAQLASNLARLEGKLPADNPLSIQLRERLAALQGDATTAAADSAEPLTGFTLTISVDETLAASVPEDAFLFVFAQDANGDNKMPAAVVRMPLKEMPLTVTLSNENAMTPTYSLNQLSAVRIVARVSADQQAPAQTGDLEGVINAPVVTGQLSELEIVINKELM